MKRLLVLVYFLCGCIDSTAPREPKCTPWKTIKLHAVSDTVPDSLKTGWKVEVRVCK